MNDLSSVTEILTGKKPLNVDAKIPTESIIYISIGIFIAVLLSVIIANKLSK